METKGFFFKNIRIFFIRPRRAIDICSAFIKNSRDNAKIYKLRGELHYIIENFEEAADDFYTARDLGLDSYDLFLKLGAADYQNENYLDVLENLDIAAEKDSMQECDKIYYFRGLVKMVLQQYRDAIDDIFVAISINPNNPYYYSQKANVEDALGNFKQAIKDQEKSLEIENRILSEQKSNNKNLSNINIKKNINILNLFDDHDAA